MYQINWIKTCHRFDWNFVSSSLRKFRNAGKFIHMIKLRSPKSNLKLKWMASYLIPSPLCEEFARGVHFQCCYTLLQLMYLSVSLIRIKNIQKGNYEIKIINFLDYIAIFLTDITCLNRMHVTIWRCIYLENKLFRSQDLWAGTYKNSINLQGKIFY